MRSVRLPLALAFVLSAAAARGAPAAAQPELVDPLREEARALLREGVALEARGELVAALDRFKRAQAAFPGAGVHYNLGRTYERLGRTVDALAAYEAFLAGSGAEDPELQAEARAAIAALSKHAASLEIVSDAVGAEVFVNGRSVGRVPLPAPVRLDPGALQISIEPPGGAPLLARGRLRPGQRETLTANLPRPAAPPPARPLPPPPAASPARPAPPVGPLVVEARRPEPRPLHRNPYAWAAAGVVLGALGLVLLTGRSDDGCPFTVCIREAP